MLIIGLPSVPLLPSLSHWECSARGAWAETHYSAPHSLGTDPPSYRAP